MPKIVIIGAGSGFGSRLSVDILSREALRGATIALCDVHEERLSAVTRYVQRVIDAHQLPAQVVASTDRRELLPGADFVITSVSVGGPAYWGSPYDIEIHMPQKYGVDQAIGDTVGPGGVFRFLRTGPVQLEFCRDIERYCPAALLLNYTNPMAMLTWLHTTGSAVRNVGLCHSVQWTSWEITRFLKIPKSAWLAPEVLRHRGAHPLTGALACRVAGINHQAWFLDITHNGRDIYPDLRAAARDPEVSKKDAVRFEMLRQFGYFVTESTPHNSEYLPYFRRTPALRERFGLEGDKVVPDVGKEREWMQQTGGETPEVPKLEPSHEYAAGIIEAVLADAPYQFNGNVMNTGLIANLPQGCCVEVPCIANAQGVHPCHVGALPTVCAALNRSNVAVQELAVEAVLNKDREAAFHAVALDPLTAACCSLEQARAMFDEMWDAEMAKGLLGWFA